LPEAAIRVANESGINTPANASKPLTTNLKLHLPTSPREKLEAASPPMARMRFPTEFRNHHLKHDEDD
jgi:hypothetical protein